MRLEREALRRGLHGVEELVVISDGAEWIRNTCAEVFGGGKVTFVLDMFHALEYASDAVKAIFRTRRSGTGGSQGSRRTSRRAGPPR